jgi:hypothetical protein
MRVHHSIRHRRNAHSIPENAAGRSTPHRCCARLQTERALVRSPCSPERRDRLASQTANSIEHSNALHRTYAQVDEVAETSRCEQIGAKSLTRTGKGTGAIEEHLTH